jgi:hypothetical protein
VLVGASDGTLYQIDVTDQSILSVTLGDGIGAVGAPLSTGSTTSSMSVQTKESFTPSSIRSFRSD